MTEDYSVTWNEVKGIVDKLLDGDERMCMGDVKRAIDKAWDIIYDDRCVKYGSKNNIVYRYACLMRPPGPGAVPRDGLEYCNTDPYVHPFTGRECWGYCDYDHLLTDKEVSAYELDYVNVYYVYEKK